MIDQKFEFCMKMIDYYTDKDDMMVKMYSSIISKYLGLPVVGTNTELKILSKLGMKPNKKNFGIN